MNDALGLGLVAGTAFVAAVAFGFRSGARRYPTFWSKDVTFVLDKETAELFRRYWGKDTTDEDIVKRINQFQEKALQVVNYPCIQRFGFASFRLVSHKTYVNAILPQIGNVSILDIGCMLGTDLRGVIANGGDPAKLTGIELEQPFIDLGFQFFGDAEGPHMKGMFRQGNVLEAGAIDKSHLRDLKGRFDFVFIGSVLHLFNLADQERLFDFMDKALKPERGIAFGRTTGVDPPGSYNGRDLHSVESLTKLLKSRGYTDIDVFEVPLDEMARSMRERFAKDWIRGNRKWLSFSYRRPAAAAK
jgi:SAM-dependent methyltransferase